MGTTFDRILCVTAIAALATIAVISVGQGVILAFHS